MLRRRLQFYGWVQGVGFRYRAYYAANRFGVTGWVCNCSDGSVRMEVQGKEADIDAMILAIEQGSYVRIENFSSRTIPVREERGFSIRHDNYDDEE